jgi:putative signal transducing protein
MNKNITSRPEAEWMVAYVTYDFHEAHIIAGRLQSEDIAVMVHQQAGANAIGIHVGRLGEIRVLVHPQDYDLAMAILYPDEADALTDDVDQIIFGDENE